jgi:hypothetical protein
MTQRGAVAPIALSTVCRASGLSSYASLELLDDELGDERDRRRSGEALTSIRN